MIPDSDGLFATSGGLQSCRDTGEDGEDWLLDNCALDGVLCGGLALAIRLCEGTVCHARYFDFRRLSSEIGMRFPHG